MATRAERVEVACGVLAGVGGIVSLLAWLYVPWRAYHPFVLPDGHLEVQHFSMTSYWPRGWEAWVYPPALALYILVPLVAAVALAAYWHGARRASAARLWLWGAVGGLLVLLLVAPQLGGSVYYLWAMPIAAPFLLPCAVLALVAAVLAVGVEADRRDARPQGGVGGERPQP